MAANCLPSSGVDSADIMHTTGENATLGLREKANLIPTLI